MKIRTKLIIAFLAVILAPILLLLGSLSVITHFQVKDLQQSYGISKATDLLSSDMIQLFAGFTSGVRSEIREIKENDSTGLDDPELWLRWDSELENGNASVVVMEDGQVVFDGREIPDEGLYQILPTIPESDSDQQFLYLGSPWQSFVSAVSFETASGGNGEIYLLTSLSVIYPQFQTLMLDIGVMVLMILVITALLLFMWLYSSILKPLATLQKAARSIRDGNLDFSLEVSGHDEISELCQDFEDMRIRLKTTAEEKLQYDRENKVLISNISHDLKTPLTAVKGYCEGILDGVAASPEKLEKYIRTIYNKANDMQRLLDELTLYSRIDTNRIPYNFAKIRVKDYFGDCAEELAMDLESRNIEMTYSNFLADDVVVIADGEQLHRVVNNIIGNSVKYMDKKKGFISLRLRDDGDFIHMEIEDNGKGIAAKDLPYIFDRFYRTDSSRNSSTGGSGIGLSIVKKIVEDHGGQIWATSKEGIGTIMHVVLRKYQEVPYE